MPERVKDPETGQLGFLQQIRGETRFIPDDPANDPAVGVGAFKSSLISAGRSFREIPTRVSAAAGGDEARRKLAETENLFASLNAEHPIATAVGQAVPGFAVPGGKVAQIGVGAIEGILADPENPFTGAATGAAAGFVGQKVGEGIGTLVQNSIRQLSRSAATRATREATETLSRIEPNPLRASTTIGERGAGSFNTLPARVAERARSTALGAPALGVRRQANLNRQFASALGVRADALTEPVLGKISQDTSEVFQSAAKSVDVIPITQNFSDSLGHLAGEADEIVPNVRALKQLELIENISLGDKMTGEQYLRIRTRLGSISRNEWLPGGDAISGGFVDDMITVLDDMFAEAAPDLSEALGPARQRWRLLSAVRRGGALDPRGNVNPNTMQRSLESTFTMLDRGGFEVGATGVAQKANRAAQQFPAEASSRTAERLASLNPLVQVKSALLNIGGGAPAAFGGNLAREVTTSQRKQSTQEQDKEAQ